MPKEASSKSKSKSADKEPKSKAKKDPNAPKRGLSAYMFFSQDWRDRVKAENPEAGFGEIGKLLGAKWKELDDSEKKPYLDQAAKDKKRAETAKAEYDATNPGGSKSTKASKASKAKSDEEADEVGSDE